MSIRDLSNELENLLEDWEVYSPAEEEYEANFGHSVYRGKYNATDIRNIMMSYFMKKDMNIQSLLNKVRELIDILPDETVITFLRNQGDTVVQEVNESLIHEGMWESPFKVKNAEVVADLLAHPITFAELDSDESQSRLWNVIGDDNFWDGVSDMAYDFPDNDARSWIVDMLKEWMEQKDSFNSNAYSEEAEELIKNAIEMFEEGAL